MRVQDVMSRRPVTIGPGEPLTAARDLMSLKKLRHLVVVDEGKVVGMLSRHDTQTASGDPIEGTVRDMMVDESIVLTPSHTIRSAANKLQATTDRALAVLDGRKLVGVLSISDLLRLFGRGLVAPEPRKPRPILAKRAPRLKPKIARM